MKIKICGITNKIDAIKAAELGVDMLGFVFYGKSARHVEPLVARDIISELPQRIMKIGVFVDEDPKLIRSVAEDTGLDALQFHGSETPEFCASFRKDYRIIKAFRIRSCSDLRKINDYDTDYYLLDTYKADAAGGTGEVFDWKILRDFELLRPIILSGGLNASNVGAAIEEVVPCGVDVSSGVEKKPGKKDPELMKIFVERARKAE